MNTVDEEKAYGAANMTANKQLQIQIHLSVAATEVTTWGFADKELVTNQLERDIYGITSNEQNQFKKEFSICLIKFQSWWKTIGIQSFRKTMEQCVKHFRYPKMHLVSQILESIR